MTGMVGEARDASSSEFAGPARVRVFAVGVLVAAFLIGGCGGGGSSTTAQPQAKPNHDAALREHKDNPTHPDAGLKEHKDNPTSSDATLREHKENPTQTSQAGQ
jgi:hypothetical protein